MAALISICLSLGLCLSRLLSTSAERGSCTGMAELSGGEFHMGTDAQDARDGENPSRRMRVTAFSIDRSPVTNEEFRRFVREKKFKTESERFGWSFVFHAFVPEDVKSKIKESVQASTRFSSAVPGCRSTSASCVSPLRRLLDAI